jgi:AbiV family abortive infection protein
MKKTLRFAQIVQGISEIIRNGAELIEEAKLLEATSHYARAYMIAHTACEELGKVSILLGVATRLSNHVEIDWNTFWRRMRSHESKATQFLVFGEFLKMIRPMLDCRSQKPVKASEIPSGNPTRGLLLSLIATRLHSEARIKSKDKVESRSSGLYVDIYDQMFKRPSQVIAESDARSMIETADLLLEGTVHLGGSEEDLATSLKGTSERILHDFSFISDLRSYIKTNNLDASWIDLIEDVRDQILGQSR